MFRTIEEAQMFLLNKRGIDMTTESAAHIENSRPFSPEHLFYTNDYGCAIVRKIKGPYEIFIQVQYWNR